MTGSPADQRAPRPRPAASLMTVWHDASGDAHIFMGRRDPSLRFMPGFLVFPGGRVEAQDRQHCFSDLLNSDCAAALNAEALVHAAQSFAQAALRECREETGLDPAPHLDTGLVYIARAITPPHFPIRYDTRFFLAHIEAQARPPEPQTKGDGELLEPGWFAAERLANEPLHHVTRAVLKHGLQNDVAQRRRLLVADRTPKRWDGSPALRSRDLKAAQSLPASP